MDLIFNAFKVGGFAEAVINNRTMTVAAKLHHFYTTKSLHNKTRKIN